MSTETRSIDQTIGLLATDEGVAEACAEVERWAKSGRADDLVALSKAIESAAVVGRPAKGFETVADHVEDQLALSPNAHCVDALLDLSRSVRTRSVVVPRDRALRVRSFASRLGFGQPLEGFLRVLEHWQNDPEHRELLACWMHEIVLRGTSLEAESHAKAFNETLIAADHPLGGLPLALRPAEREAPSYMPLYGDRGFSNAVERLTSGAMSVRTIPPPADGAAVRATRVDDAELIARMKTAATAWSKHEAKVFELSPAIEASTVGSWLLRALPLDSTAEAPRLDCSRTGSDGVFGPLFSAASNGGAYSAGVGGAYGRRAAWTSLGALVGAPARATVAAVEDAAKGCAFLAFRAPGPWFFDVAWDLGGLVLRADGKSVAVLAATDND